MKKNILFIVVILFAFLDNFLVANERINSLKEIEKNNKKVLRNDTNIIIFKDDFIDETFFIPARKISLNTIYSGIFSTNISNKNKEYLKKWKQYANTKSNNDTIISTVLDNQIDLFYEEFIVVEGGNRVSFIVPKHLSIKMKKELVKNDKIILNFSLLAIKHEQNLNSIYAVVDGFEKVKELYKDEIKTQTTVYKQIENSLKNNNYDSALANLSTLIKNNKNNAVYKKNYCDVWMAKLFKFNTSITKDIINCYINLKQSDNYEVNYALAILYFKTNVISSSVKNKFIISYTSKVIDSFATKNLSLLTQNETEIYYNSLYIRGITKLQENDKTGQNDLDLCENHNIL